MTFSTPFRSLGTLAALALLGAASVAQTVDNKPQVKAEILDRVTAIITGKAYVPGVDLSRWKAFVADEKTKLDDAKNDEEFTAAINEAMERFGASHLTLASPRSTDFRATGSFVGIGIRPMKTDDGTLILRTFPTGGAAKAGLVPGDLIVKVDGKPADGPSGIAGKEGTKVTLTVRHKDGRTEDVAVTRGKFSTRIPETLTEVDKDTAMLTVDTFDLGYSPDNVEMLMRKAARYPNLILDLRDNGGGVVDYMQHLLGLFAPDTKPFGTFVSKRLAKDYVEKTGGQEKDVVKIADWVGKSDTWSDHQMRPLKGDIPVYKGHVAVLVNGSSFSAAEICAAALHDLVGADVVGTKSGGAVLMARMDPVGHGFELEYAFQDYVTISGQRLEGTGLKPTVEVADPKYRIANASDPVVEKAAEVLEKRVASVGGAR